MTVSWRPNSTSWTTTDGGTGFDIAASPYTEEVADDGSAPSETTATVSVGSGADRHVTVQFVGYIPDGRAILAGDWTARFTVTDDYGGSAMYVAEVWVVSGEGPEGPWVNTLGTTTGIEVYLDNGVIEVTVPCVEHTFVSGDEWFSIAFAVTDRAGGASADILMDQYIDLPDYLSETFLASPFH